MFPYEEEQAAKRLIPALYSSRVRVSKVNTVPEHHSFTICIVSLTSVSNPAKSTRKENKIIFNPLERNRYPKHDVPPSPGDVSSSFIIFNALPQELRLMIWQEALPGPRIVQVTQARLASS